MWSVKQLALLVVTCVLLLVATADAAPLKEPRQVFPRRNGKTRLDLRVAVHSLRVPLENNGGEQAYFEYTARVFETKKGKPLVPGPTVYARPGGKIMMTVTNSLGKETPVAVPDSMVNYTNVHFHGLHSSPSADNPFRVISPGDKMLYKIGLERDHEPGMHWYHNHVHGSSALQVMGGLFGAIVVQEGTFITSRVHPLRDTPRHIMMMHLYRLANKSTHCDGPSMESLDGMTASNVPSNARVVDRNGQVLDAPEDLLLVNAQHRPTVTVTTGTPSLLLMAYAAGQCYVNMSLPPQCDFHTVAVDGIQQRRTRQVKKGWLYFTTATRMTAAVVCTEPGVYPVTRNNNASEVIFYVEAVQGKSPAPAVTFPVLLPRYNPDYLALEGATRTRTREISFSQRGVATSSPKQYVIGQGNDCSSLHNDSTCVYKSFSGERGKDGDNYDGFAVPLHSVVTARVYGDPDDPVPHPLHFHVNHFKVLSFEPRPGGQHENHTLEMYDVYLNKFRDTVPILDGVTTIQWQAATYPGEVVYHCHTLHHQDMGMMLSYYVYPDIKGTFYSPEVPPPPTPSWVYAVEGFLVLLALSLLAASAYMYLRRRGASGTASETQPLLP